MSEMAPLFSVLTLGFLLGMRHATDADHVIAVSTILSRYREIGRAALIGLYWGLGHTLTILVVGVAIIFLGLTIPARLGLTMEFSVGLMLIVLGAANIAAFFRKARVTHSHDAVDAHEQALVHSHAHRHGDYVHSHPHGHGPESHGHPPGRTPLARIDRWLGGARLYPFMRPLVVGVVHGLAGSAAVALLVLTTVPDVRWALAYLLIFGLGTMAGMMLVTVSLASACTFAGNRSGVVSRWVGVVSGAASLGFGLFLTYRIGVVEGLFSSLF